MPSPSCCLPACLSALCVFSATQCQMPVHYYFLSSMHAVLEIIISDVIIILLVVNCFNGYIYIWWIVAQPISMIDNFSWLVGTSEQELRPGTISTYNDRESFKYRSNVDCLRYDICVWWCNIAPLANTRSLSTSMSVYRVCRYNTSIHRNKAKNCCICI